MKSPLAPSLRTWPLIALMMCVWRPGAEAQSGVQPGASTSAQPASKTAAQKKDQAQPVPARVQIGTVEGFFEVRGEDGRLLASGTASQIAHGSRITSHTVFNFKDGSLDDETTVFSQARTLRLISDHHIQKGPFFPHPMETTVDAASGEFTVRSTDKDGKPQVKTDHLNLPADLANGMVAILAENMRPDATETVSMVVATPKARLVKLALSSLGEETFSSGGSSHKAIHYQIKIELGGVAGVVAPLIGKQPPDLQLWITSGPAPIFVREQGPLEADAPLTTIQLAGTEWPETPKAAR